MLKGKIYLQKIVNKNEYQVGDILIIDVLKRVESHDKETKYLAIKKSGQDKTNLYKELDLSEDILVSEKDFVNLSKKSVYAGRVLHITDSYVSNMQTLIIEIEQ